MLLKSGTVQRDLYDSLPTLSFVRFDSLRTFKLNHPEVLYKTRGAVTGMDVVSEELVALPFGRAVAMTCGTVTVGYRIVTPAVRSIEVRSNFAAFSRRELKSTTDVRRYLANRDVFIMGNADAMLAVGPSARWVRLEE